MRIPRMLLCACLSSVLAPAHAATEHRLVATEGIRWAGNYRQARAAALRLHRLLLLDMETDWCSWCRVMDDDVYPAPPVAKKLRQGYLCVRENAESDSDGVVLQRKFRITTYPATIIVEPEGELYITIYGYRDADQLLSEIESATEQLRELSGLENRVGAGMATTEGREKLAEAFADRGFYDKAAKVYLALLQDPRVNLPPEVLFRAAVSLASAGDGQNALAAIGDLEKNFPDSEAVPEGEALQGEILWHEGDAIRARLVLKQWLEKYPGNPLADHVRSVLAKVGQTQ